MNSTKFTCIEDNRYCNITLETNVSSLDPGERMAIPMTKEQYIEKINILMSRCNSLPLLDLILQILVKSL